MDQELRELERRIAAGERVDPVELERARGRVGAGTRAVIGCVHGNLQALQAVLADIERRGIGDVICLGDLIGYGGDPLACIDLVRERCRVVLRGNHDDKLFSDGVAWGSIWALHTVNWTRERLRPGVLASSAMRDRWRFMETLPLRHEEHGVLFVHGSPRDPMFEYLLEGDLLQGADEKYREVFAAFPRLLVVAHSHLPGVITETPLAWKAAGALPDATWELGHRAILNAGSVGQPRDRDPRACWLELSASAARWHRVEYDVEAAIARMVGVGFHEALAARLREGI